MKNAAEVDKEAVYSLFLSGATYNDICQTFDINLNTLKNWIVHNKWKRNKPQEIEVEKEDCITEKQAEKLLDQIRIEYYRIREMKLQEYYEKRIANLWHIAMGGTRCKDHTEMQ